MILLPAMRLARWFEGLFLAVLLMAGGLSAQLAQPQGLPPGTAVSEKNPSAAESAESQQPLTIRVIAKELPGEPPLAPGPATRLFLTDPLGRRAGVDPETNDAYAEIPGMIYRPAEDAQTYRIASWTYTLPSGERVVIATLMVPEATEGRYELLIRGSGAKKGYTSYELVVEAGNQAGRPWTHLISGSVEPGAVDRYGLFYSGGSDEPIQVARIWNLSGLTLYLEGDSSELLLADPRGRRAGKDPNAKVNYQEIPRSAYVDISIADEETGEPTPPVMVIDIRQPLDGSYLVEVIGTRLGNYSLEIYAQDEKADSPDSNLFEDIPTAPGMVHLYALEYTRAPGAPLRVAGGFDGGGQMPSDVNRFLTYANPNTAQTVLQAAKTTFDLILFYGPTINPTSFKAKLNGTDVSSRFQPVPGSYQLVAFQFARGSHTLVLSVEGTTAAGQLATDIDELVFLVRNSAKQQSTGCPRWYIPLGTGHPQK